jgi:hypothetical protein
MRSILAAAALAAVVLVGCQTAQDQQSAATDQGGSSSTQAASSPSGGATSAGGALTTPQKIDLYVQARRQLESQYPDMRPVFGSGGELSPYRNRLEAALRGSPLSPDEFASVHQQVMADPQLRARVMAALDAPPAEVVPGAGTSGATTPPGETLPGWRGAPSGAQPPTTSGGAIGAPPGGAAAPSASPK